MVAIACITVFAVTTSANAAKIVYPNIYRCQDVIANDSRRSDDAQAGVDRLALESWINGFVSAWNVYGPTDGELELKAGPAMSWLIDYCRQNPGKSIGDGVVNLILDMERNREAKK
jgi:hypothetical protein